MHHSEDEPLSLSLSLSPLSHAQDSQADLVVRGYADHVMTAVMKKLQIPIPISHQVSSPRTPYPHTSDTKSLSPSS